MSSPVTATDAPPLATTRWFNVEAPLTLDSLRGRVVVLLAFQMLCPGCVARSIPLAKRLDELFAEQDVAVIGLHTVFEHHEAMQPGALQAFLYEYRVRFPVAVDKPDPNGLAVPLTMQAYRLRGTPSLVLIDAAGRIRSTVFGAHDELELGTEIGLLLAERGRNAEQQRSIASPTNAGVIHCDDEACTVG